MAYSLENSIKSGWTQFPFSKKPDNATSLKRPEDVQTRREVVGFIWEVKQRYNLDSKLTYLAINYVHRVFNKKSFATVEEDLEIIATACVSLAAETLGSVVDLMVAKPVYFEYIKARLRGWLCRCMKSITPFTFLAPFICLIDYSIQSTLKARATEILFQVQRENEDFLVYTPSAIAVAALFCAAEELFPEKFSAYRETVYSRLEFHQEQDTPTSPDAIC